MNDLKIFENAEFGQIRTVIIDSEPYFSGKDVASSLGYANPQKAIRDHVDDEDKTLNELFTVNGTMGILINESGLYSLILSSKLPSAKKFKRWVTSEVLPSLRKNGHYEMPNMSSELKAILMIDQRTIKMEERIDRLEYDVPLYGSESDELSSHLRRKVVKLLGGAKSEAYKDKSVSKKAFADIYNQLKREYGLYNESGRKISYKALKRKYLSDAHEFIDCYELPTHLIEMVNNANGQTRLEFT